MTAINDLELVSYIGATVLKNLFQESSTQILICSELNIFHFGSNLNLKLK